MADIVQQQQPHSQIYTNGMVEVESTVDELQTITVTEIGPGEHGVETGVGVEVTEDILQQALEVAAESFGQNVELEYAEVDEVPADQDVGTELVTSAVDSRTVATLVQHVETGSEVNFEEAGYNVDVDETVTTQEMEELSNTGVDDMNTTVADVMDNGDLVQTISTEISAEELDPVELDPDAQVFTLQTSDAPDGQGLKVTLLPANAGSGAPLGSSQNPIRIIQQGNQYTPVQQLSTDQLSQIMQVVQQQQLAKSAQEGGGSSTLFNPHTNTRIVYRVIYPSELHKSAKSSISQISTHSQGQQTFVPRKTYKKRRIEEEEEEKADAPELSREEKEERKKHRPRTRSGRVSKPPKHMVQDYKHIHVLDWDEDPYDDSDGGYSDFKYSDDEHRNHKDNDDSNDFTDWGVTRPKNWKCKTCKKAYIGKGGLGRHYRLNPDHGDESEMPDEPRNNEDGVYGNVVTNGIVYSEQFSEDSNTQDSFPSSTATTSATTLATTNIPLRRRRGWPRGVPRSRPTNVLESVPSKRKAKLRELVKHCEDEELMEVVLPRLKDVVSLWEFLLMKVEKGNPARPYVGDVLVEYEALHKRVQKMCQKYLEPLQNSQLENPHIDKIKIQDANIASSLGMDVGTYTVKTISETEESIHHRLTTGDNLHATSTWHLSQTPAPFLLKKDHLASPSNKRVRMDLPQVGIGGSSPQAMGPTSTQIPTGLATTLQSRTSSSAFNVINIQSEIQQMPNIVNSTSSAATSKVNNALGTMVTLAGPAQGALVSVSGPNSTVSGQSLLSTAISSVSQAPVRMSPLPLGTMSRAPSQVVFTNSGSIGALTSNHQSLLTTSSQASSDSQSTQITIPVVLPQGTERISLELPSHLAGSIIDGIAQGQSVSVAPHSTGDGGTPTHLIVDGSIPERSQLSTKQVDTGQSDIVETNIEDNIPAETGVEQQLVTVHNLSEVHLQAMAVDGQAENTGIAQFVQEGGEISQIAAIENGTEIVSEDQIVEGHHIITGSNIFQTEDGIVIIQQADGTVLQLQAGQNIPLETIQALLSMEMETQIEGEVEEEEIEAIEFQQ